MASEVSGPELIVLKRKVVQHFDESEWIELGALTGMLDKIREHPRLLRSLRFGDEDYEGLVIEFLRDMIGDNGENADIVRKYVNGFGEVEGENISSHGKDKRSIVFAPEFFDVPDEEVDENLVSVMMPFSQELYTVYETIQEAASDAGYKCKRADDIWQHSTVMQDVFSLIFQSHVVICDFTDKNPNVFYEAGIAHTLGKHVIPITQNTGDVPSDLRHHKYAKYLNNEEGRSDLKTRLISRLEELAVDPFYF